jgi:CheY-like chemotaxis protein
MVRLVVDLLDVSRIERGKFNLRKEPVELSQVVAAALETVQPVFEASEHRLHVVAPKEPICLELDLVRMSQVMTNLLNNAAKYTEPGGDVWLTVAVRDGDLVIEVRDTGVGIATEMLPRIFEPFTQADQSLDRSQGGLGIGLSLVRRIVELHGGSVRVHSEGVGKGSTFTIRVPAVRATVTAAPPPPVVSSGVPPRRVLVVDDHTSQAQVLATLLNKAWGHEVSVAYDGPQALAAIEVQHPDVVLLDIGLPGMNGFEVARRVRANPDNQDILIVALSGYGQEEDQRRSEEAGFDMHLVKPPALATLKTIFTHAKLSQPTG